MTMIEKDPLAACSWIFHTYPQIITFLIFLFLLKALCKWYSRRKQHQDEADIKNMFNTDGTRNEHDTHRDYEPIPDLIIAAMLIFVNLLLIVF